MSSRVNRELSSRYYLCFWPHCNFLSLFGLEVVILVAFMLLFNVPVVCVFGFGWTYFSTSWFSRELGLMGFEKWQRVKVVVKLLLVILVSRRYMPRLLESRQHIDIEMIVVVACGREKWVARTTSLGKSLVGLI